MEKLKKLKIRLAVTKFLFKNRKIIFTALSTFTYPYILWLVANIGWIGSPSCLFLIFYGILGGLLGYAITVASNKVGYIGNWSTWSKVIVNPAIKWPVLIFVLTPSILKLIDISDIDYELPKSFYIFWLLGFFLYLYIMAYNIFSPKCFNYTSYKNFIEKRASVLEFKKDAMTIVKNLEERREHELLFDHEKEDYDRDMESLKSIIENKKWFTNDDFYILQKRATFSFTKRNAVVSLFFLPCLYIFLYIFFSNFELALNGFKASFIEQ